MYSRSNEVQHKLVPFLTFIIGDTVSITSALQSCGDYEWRYSDLSSVNPFLIARNLKYLRNPTVSPEISSFISSMRLKYWWSTDIRSYATISERLEETISHKAPYMNQRWPCLRANLTHRVITDIKSARILTEIFSKQSEPKSSGVRLSVGSAWAMSRPTKYWRLCLDWRSLVYPGSRRGGQFRHVNSMFWVSERLNWNWFSFVKLTQFRYIEKTLLDRNDSRSESN